MVHPTIPVERPRNFQVVCRADDSTIDVVSESVSFTLSTRTRLEGEEQMWGTVQIFGNIEADGSLLVQVMLWDTKLEKPLQIASIKSRPDEASQRDTLECDLTQTVLG